MVRAKALIPLTCCLLLWTTGCGQPAGEQAESDNHSNTQEPVVIQCYDRMPQQPQVTISSLRITSSGRNETVQIDWQGDGSVLGFMTLVIIDGDGKVHEINSAPSFAQSGSLGAEFTTYGSGGGDTSLASGCQVFVGMRAYDGLFKLSNILTSGSTPHSVQADPPKQEWIDAAEQELKDLQSGANSSSTPVE